MCSAHDDIVSKSLIVKKEEQFPKKSLLIISVCSFLVGMFVWIVVILICNCYNLFNCWRSCSAQKKCLDWKEKQQLENLVRDLVLKVKIPKMHQSLNGFNLIAMPTSCKNSRKGIVLRTQLKTMSGHLEIFILREWLGMHSMALMTSVQKTCLRIRAKPATGYASLCVKLKGLMEKITHHAVFTCFWMGYNDA